MGKRKRTNKEKKKDNIAQIATKVVTSFVNKGKIIPEKSDNTPKNRKLEKLCKMTQEQLKMSCEHRLENLGYEPVSKDGFLFAKGTYPVLLLAHLDTVHVRVPQTIVYKEGKMYSPEGIGGDDRCGVYIIFELIKELNCSVVFLEDEEIGCVGASKFAKSAEALSLSTEINYMMEFDRRGTTDAVFYDCDNTDFVKFIEETGYFKEQWGSYSDIAEIAPAMKIAGVNLSSAYHSEHTCFENIELDALELTIDKAKEILYKPCEKPFEYIEAYVYTGYYGRHRTQGKWDEYLALEYYDEDDSTIYKDWEDFYEDDFYEDDFYEDDFYGDYNDHVNKAVLRQLDEKEEAYEKDSITTHNGKLVATTHTDKHGVFICPTKNTDIIDSQVFHIYYDDTACDFIAEIMATSEEQAVYFFLMHFSTAQSQFISAIKSETDLSK